MCRQQAIHTLDLRTNRIFHQEITGQNLKPYIELLLSISITTISWILVTLITKPTDNDKLPAMRNHGVVCMSMGF